MSSQYSPGWSRYSGLFRKKKRLPTLKARPADSFTYRGSASTVACPPATAEGGAVRTTGRELQYRAPEAWARTRLDPDGGVGPVVDPVPCEVRGHQSPRGVRRLALPSGGGWCILTGCKEPGGCVERRGGRRVAKAGGVRALRSQQLKLRQRTKGKKQAISTMATHRKAEKDNLSRALTGPVTAQPCVAPPPSASGFGQRATVNGLPPISKSSIIGAHPTGSMLPQCRPQCSGGAGREHRAEPSRDGALHCPRVAADRERELAVPRTCHRAAGSQRRCGPAGRGL